MQRLAACSNRHYHWWGKIFTGPYKIYMRIVFFSFSFSFRSLDDFDLSLSFILYRHKHCIPSRHIYILYMYICVCRNSVIDCIVLTSHLKIVEKEKDKTCRTNIDTSFSPSLSLFYFILSIGYWVEQWYTLRVRGWKRI
jgi:hypothetical protein